jgi:hypothetical protein
MVAVADPQMTSAKTDRAQVKRRAGSALRRAGRTHLADLGVRPMSSSPRQWLGDHGWWLINVEFQSSSWSVGSYLNVGIQYLWTVKDHRSFGHANPRVPIPGCGQFADLDGAEDVVRANADAVGRAARDAVRGLTSHLQDDDSHMQWLSRATGTGLWETYDAAIASGLLAHGKDASSKFADIQRGLDRTIDWQNQLASDCEHLAELALDPDRFRSEVDERIADTRQRLHLRPSGDGQ